MVRAQRGVRRDDDADRAVHPRELFDGGDVLDIAHAGAAVLGRKHDAQQAELAQFLDRRQRKVAGLVPLHHVGRDFALGKFADAFLQLQLLIVQLEIQDALFRVVTHWIRTQEFQPTKLPAERGFCVGRTPLSGRLWLSSLPRLEISAFPSNRVYKSQNETKHQPRRTGVSDPH